MAFKPTVPASHYITTLANVEMPRIIYGTAWKKDRTSDLVVQAVTNGFRGIDVACQPRHYNEPAVGEALQILQMLHGIARSELFLQTKFTSVDGQDPKNIPYDPRSPLKDQVRQSYEKSKENLAVDVIDSLVLHSPLRTFADTLTVWREMEKIHREGGVRQIGISNCYDGRVLRHLWESAEVKPSVVQNRFYSDTGYDMEIRQFCNENRIVYQSFWTLTGNPQILRSSVVGAIAAREGRTREHVWYRYCMNLGISVLCGTTNQERMKSDTDLLDWDGLTKSDMEQIGALL